ncbi:MAG: 1,4-dihydroxy-2-naphthoate polyprenyltransferase [Cyclobacteriaceae bacterium]|nr:1,4-dihydroxy-2-naphthoate polyprenyltransferase [Cyclobacteriaceae bacterium]
MNIKVWIHALRFRTLPLSLSCIGMGGFLAAADDKFDWSLFFLCCITTIFLQLLSNLANDYGDSIHGADSDARIGPARAVQTGAISSKSMLGAVILFSLLSLVSGILLLFLAFGNNWQGILFFFGLGILSILAAVGYTVGKKPYGYLGLGDFSVLIFFGLVGVLGSYYLFTQHVSWLHILPAMSCGLFSIAVLNLNNIRDIESDRLAGKFSIPVRIGKKNAARYHWILLIGGLLSAMSYTLIVYKSPWQFLFLLSVPLFLRNGLAVQNKPSAELDPFLRQMAISTLIFVLLFGIGLIIT